MNAQTQKFQIDGPVGKIECALDVPEAGTPPRYSRLGKQRL